MRIYTALILAAIFSCSSNEPNKLLPSGIWGGDQVGLWVSENSSNIQWGCAAATFIQRLNLENSKVSAYGSYKFIGGAQPADPSLLPPERPIRLSGTLNGEEFRFTVTFMDTNEKLGDFLVFYNKEPFIFYCA